MAPTTYHLIALKATSSHESFLSALGRLPQKDRPLYVGKCQHWIHAPRLSVEALTGPKGTMLKWDYLIVNQSSQTGTISSLSSLIERQWSITTIDDYLPLADYTTAHHTRKSKTTPPLPSGWSPKDHSALDAAVPPPDLELSLGVSSFPLGSKTDSGQEPVVLKDFVRDFGSQHTGPTNMFNLLSYVKDQRPRYFEYIAAFAESVGSKYGGDAMVFGLGVSDWSSKDRDGDAGWEDAGLV